MDTIPGTSRVVLDVLRAPRQGATGIARRRRDRLAGLVEHARRSSPYYRARYADLPVGPLDLDLLPPVTKPELMAAFDDWVTDPAITLEGVERFTADPGCIGTPYLGSYFVARTSGTSGHVGLFVHDRGAQRVYEAYSYRADVAWLSAHQWLQLLHRRARWAAVVGTGGHFAGEGWMGLQRRRSLWRRHSYRVFSLQQPIRDLAASLDAFRPAIVTGYPSALQVLAEEQAAGRLHLRPLLVELGGESSDADDRARIATALGGALHDAYAASEFLAMAFDCSRGWLHVNSDWVILEPVGADYSPTPAGSPSHTVLLTNLANRVQPLIRYDLGDSVTLRPGPCPCGSPLPAIRVEGRREDVLRIASAPGREVPIPPLALASAVGRTDGVHRSQVVQTGPRTVRLRLDVRPEAERDQVWDLAIANLSRFLAGQGVTDVELVRAAEAPRPSPTSGKFRHVIGTGAADA